MKLRLQYKGNTTDIDFNELVKTFNDLKLILLTSFNIPESDLDRLIVLHGFPPKRIELPPETPIEELNLTANSKLTLNVVYTSNSTPQQAVAPITTTNPPITSLKRKRSTRGDVEVHDEEDVASVLVQSVSLPTNQLSATLQFLKKAANLAVGEQYRRSEATNRHAASLSGEYTTRPVTTSHRLGSDLTPSVPTHLEVEFKKGPSSKKMVKETVEWASSEDQLKETLSMIVNSGEVGKDLLKPYNLSLVSPRLFWSLLHYGGKDLEATMKRLLPRVDFSFLNKRAAKLSEKALANQLLMEASRVEREIKRREREERKKKNTGEEDVEEGEGDEEMTVDLASLLAISYNMCDLLSQAGVETPKDLKSQKAASLLHTLKHLFEDAEEDVLEDLPSLSDVKTWIKISKDWCEREE